MTMTIDLTKHLGLMGRELSVSERNGRPAHVVTASRTYETEIEDVWDAITNPERIPRWFLPVTGELRAGGRFQLEGNAGGQITRCDAPEALAVTWEFAGDVSWVEVELSVVDAQSTRLVLRHIAHTPPDFWERYGPGATGVGWELGLVGLAEHLWGAADVDHREAEQWPATEDGKRFVADAAEGWARAQIATGTAEGAAKAAAARTLAFYTGQQEPSPSAD